MIKIAAIKTKEGSGPPGLDVDEWRKILLSNSYVTTNADLRKAFANVVKKIYTDKVQANRQKKALLLACRLISLNMNPVLLPIGIGDILDRIAEGVVIKIVKEDKEDLTKTASPLQLCPGQEAGSEATIHSMHSVFEANETEAIVLVDAENAFNSVNWKVLLHNVEHFYPAVSTYLQNC